ncbi:hypothetical protein PENTCL1PPCAC_15667, partial [Pristionchus entomophagus]
PNKHFSDSFHRHLAALTGIIFFAFTIFVGPINILGNIFVMFIMTRKELRSSHNFVFFLMALDQTIVIGSLTITSFRTMLLLDCTPSYFSLFWAVFDLTTQQLVPICKAHATWLAVIIALMRLMSIRSHGSSELQSNLVLLLSGATMLFVILANTPNFFSVMIVWVPIKVVCNTTDFGDILIPGAIESPMVYMNDCLILRLGSLMLGLQHSALPCLLLVVLSGILLRFLQKTRKDREAKILHRNLSNDGDKTTALLVLIMVSTIISEIPQAVLGLLEGFRSSKMRSQVTEKL